MPRQISSFICSAILSLAVPAQSTASLNNDDLGYGCLAFPAEPLGFDTLDKSAMRTFMPNLRYVVNPQHLAFTPDETGDISMRQKFVPSSKGTDRVIAVINMPAQRVYEITQKIIFEEGFVWGGEKESGKIGFGLAGGSAPAGGELEDDGFSLRLTWKGNNDGTAQLGTYVYTADRIQNPPWGDVYPLEDWSVPIGEWFIVNMLVTMNSSIDASDGSLVVAINDDVKLQQENIKWVGSGDKPSIDQMLYSSFYGGNSELWSPNSVTHVRFTDVCVRRP